MTRLLVILSREEYGTTYKDEGHAICAAAQRITDVITSHEDKRTEGAVKDSCEKQIESVRACIDLREKDGNGFIMHGSLQAEQKCSQQRPILLRFVSRSAAHTEHGYLHYPKACVFMMRKAFVFMHPESKIFLESIFKNGVHLDDCLRANHTFHTDVWYRRACIQSCYSESSGGLRIHHIQPIRDHVCFMIRQLMIKSDTDGNTGRFIADFAARA